LKNKEVEKNLEKYIQPNYITKVDTKLNNDYIAYNKQLSVYNNRFKTSALALLTTN
jgi:hypothetical protein